MCVRNAEVSGDLIVVKTVAVRIVGAMVVQTQLVLVCVDRGGGVAGVLCVWAQWANKFLYQRDQAPF